MDEGENNDQTGNDRTKSVTWEDPRPGARKVKQMSGSQYFEEMRRGNIPEPPFGKLLGIGRFDAGYGTFTMTLDPQEVHYNPMGCVHGGILATLLDSVMSAAVHTALPTGKGHLTIEIKANFIRQVLQASGEIMATGESGFPRWPDRHCLGQSHRHKTGPLCYRFCDVYDHRRHRRTSHESLRVVLRSAKGGRQSGPGGQPTCPCLCRAGLCRAALLVRPAALLPQAMSRQSGLRQGSGI